MTRTGQNSGGSLIMQTPALAVADPTLGSSGPGMSKDAYFCWSDERLEVITIQHNPVFACCASGAGEGQRRYANSSVVQLLDDSQVLGRLSWF